MSGINLKKIESLDVNKKMLADERDSGEGQDKEKVNEDSENYESREVEKKDIGKSQEPVLPPRLRSASSSGKKNKLDDDTFVDEDPVIQEFSELESEDSPMNPFRFKEDNSPAKEPQNQAQPNQFKENIKRVSGFDDFEYEPITQDSYQKPLLPTNSAYRNSELATTKPNVSTDLRIKVEPRPIRTTEILHSNLTASFAPSKLEMIEEDIADKPTKKKYEIF